MTLLAQDGLHSSTVTLGVGGETPTYNHFGESSGPVFKGNYEFRILKHLAVEAGEETILPQVTNYEFIPVISVHPTGAPLVSFFQTERTRVTLAPFGAKGIWSLMSNRVELFAGGGGAYAFHGDGSYADAVLMQGNLGGRVALDGGHRFWLGTSGHFYSNVGRGRQEWLTWTADLGIRF